MAEQKFCAYAVDIDENEHEVACGKPADFQCNEEFFCHQCAHDWLDEMEPKSWHQVCALTPDEVSDG